MAILARNGAVWGLQWFGGLPLPPGLQANPGPAYATAHNGPTTAHNRHHHPSPGPANGPQTIAAKGYGKGARVTGQPANIGPGLQRCGPGLFIAPYCRPL